MLDPYSYIREGEDMICSSGKATGRCLSTPGLSIGRSITKTERLRLDNKDFDGDALNLCLSLDKHVSDGWYPIAPMFNVFELDKPYKVSGNVGIPKPVIASTSAWLLEE